MRKEYDVDSSKQSKQGAALFNQSGENYLVIFGLTKSGSLWTIVCDAGSAGNPFQPYESYQSTEKEDDKWEYKDERMMPIDYGFRLKFPRKTKTMLKMTAIAKRGEHFKTPIWIVEVESKEVARYTPEEELGLEWQERLGSSHMLQQQQLFS
jgi:hypothetical protein